MELHTLAKAILTIEGTPISKVRFAKTIYFVHKALIQQGLLHAEDVNYIRMPLGPVPFGFMSLASEFTDITTTIAPSGLSYNSVLYSLRKKVKVNSDPSPINSVISDILSGLRRVNTSELVEISHNDPSWKSHKNGMVYVITSADLKNAVPRKGSPNRLDSDDQLLQASLVKGMIDDIVNESTDLEYPVDEQ